MCALFVGLNFNLDLLSSLSCNPTSKNHFSCVLLAMFFFLSFFLIYFALYLFDEMSTRSTHTLISLLNMSLVLKISPIGFYWNIDSLISSHQSVCERHWNLPSDYVHTREGTFIYLLLWMEVLWSNRKTCWGIVWLLKIFTFTCISKI